MLLLVKQIEDSGNKLNHKAASYSNRCIQLTDTIKESVEQNISTIRKKEQDILKELEMIKSQQTIIYNNINNRLENLKEKIEVNTANGKSTNKVC